jgi:hypothetical protein
VWTGRDLLGGGLPWMVCLLRGSSQLLLKWKKKSFAMSHNDRTCNQRRVLNKRTHKRRARRTRRAGRLYPFSESEQGENRAARSMRRRKGSRLARLYMIVLAKIGFHARNTVNSRLEQAWFLHSPTLSHIWRLSRVSRVTCLSTCQVLHDSVRAA